MTTADDVVRALQALVGRVDGLRAQVGGAKSTVHTSSARVDGLVRTAHGAGNSNGSSLRACADFLKKAEDDVDRAHDRLKEAVEALDGYLDREFNRAAVGGTSRDGWEAARDIGRAHVDAFDRSRRRALVKQALLVGATGTVAAAGVGSSTGFPGLPPLYGVAGPPAFVHPASEEFTPASMSVAPWAASQGSGSVGAALGPPGLTSKCRWGPVE